MAGAARERLRTLWREARAWRLMLGHPETPRLARWLLGIALVWLVSPLDPIPDFIPLLGHLDDLVGIPLLVGIALRLIPPDVKAACRAAAGRAAR